MQILIVEDDAVLALVSAAALAEEGHDIVGPAHDMHTALALAQGRRLDLAVIDINLDGADEGIEVARFLKANHGVPSIFVSGQLAAARAHPELAVGLLRKPYEAEDLIRSVAYVQALTDGEAAAASAPPATLELFQYPAGKENA